MKKKINLFIIGGPRGSLRKTERPHHRKTSSQKDLITERPHHRKISSQKDLITERPHHRKTSSQKDLITERPHHRKTSSQKDLITESPADIVVFYLSGIRRDIDLDTYTGYL